MQRYDVIIKGTGPSGTIASKTCAEKGISTLLLEKEFSKYVRESFKPDELGALYCR